MAGLQSALDNDWRQCHREQDTQNGSTVCVCHVDGPALPIHVTQKYHFVDEQNRVPVRGGQIAEFPTLGIEDVVLLRRKVKEEAAHLNLLAEYCTQLRG
jgi:hypothetical protein